VPLQGALVRSLTIRALRQVSVEERNVIAVWLRERIEAESEAAQVAEPATAYTNNLPPYMSLDEYFEFESKSQRRYEYVNGVIYAMTGASLAHNNIAGTLFTSFKAHLRDPCRVFITDAKLKIASATDQIIYYPDLIVACNQQEWGRDYVCNPKLVVEVLSPSTEGIDRREKAMAYRCVSSIEEYVVVEQEEPMVIVQRRAENWKHQIYAGPGAMLQLRSISLEIPLLQIYEGVL